MNEGGIESRQKTITERIMRVNNAIGDLPEEKRNSYRERVIAINLKRVEKLEPEVFLSIREELIKLEEDLGL